MQRSSVVAVVVVAAIFAVMFLRYRPESAPTTTRDDVPVQTARTASQAGDSRDIASSSAADRPPQTSPPGMFRPALFSALPGGLNGRSLKQNYDDLALRVDAGDASAALVIANLVNECNGMLYGLRLGRRGGSPDPFVQKHIEEKEKIAGEQCPELGDQVLASTGKWYLRAVEMGNGDALKWLRFHGPKANEPEFDAKRAHWRKVLTEGLAQRGENGDIEAMLDLGQFYLDERQPESTQEAWRWFDRATRAAGPAYRIEFATKMRDVAEDRIGTGNGR